MQYHHDFHSLGMILDVLHQGQCHEGPLPIATKRDDLAKSMEVAFLVKRKRTSSPFSPAALHERRRRRSGPVAIVALSMLWSYQLYRSTNEQSASTNCRAGQLSFPSSCMHVYKPDYRQLPPRVPSISGQPAICPIVASKPRLVSPAGHLVGPLKKARSLARLFLAPLPAGAVFPALGTPSWPHLSRLRARGAELRVHRTSQRRSNNQALQGREGVDLPLLPQIKLPQAFAQYERLPLSHVVHTTVNIHTSSSLHLLLLRCLLLSCFFSSLYACHRHHGGGCA
jgi:hypothetical protein